MLENQDRSLEQIKQQASTAQTEDVKKLLEQGKFKQAESLAQEANLSPEDWARVNNEADDSIRGISSEKLPEGPLSVDQAQKAVTGAEDKKILEYGAKNDPETEVIQQMNGIVIENESILNELEETIIEAKSQIAGNRWAKPVGFLALPVISDIYAILKGKKLRKLLKRLEKLNSKLKNPKILNSSVDADQITPSKGHMAVIAGNAAAVVGYGTVIGGSIAAAPVAAGVGFGTVVAGGVTALIGYVRQIISFSDMGKTKQTLEKLEKQIEQARNSNNAARMQISMYNNAYIQGARENLKPMMN